MNAPRLVRKAVVEAATRTVAAEFSKRKEYTVTDLVNRCRLPETDVLEALKRLQGLGLVKCDKSAGKMARPPIWVKCPPSASHVARQESAIMAKKWLGRDYDAPTLKSVVAAVRANPGKTRRELADVIGIHADPLSTLLAKGRETGELVSTGPRGQYRWYPV